MRQLFSPPPSATSSSEIHSFQMSPDEDPNSSLPRVLVIDRSSATQYQIRLVLKDLCTTSSAYTADLALHYLETQLNMLIITAMDLPNDFTGQRLLLAIRAMEGYEHVPVIGVATREWPENQSDVLSQGFDGYFLRPFDLQALRVTVQRLLKTGVSSE